MADLVQVLGARLRDVRQREGLSLQRVEQRSGGRWKAVVVGSYERGDRAVTVQKLAELARFYGVPMSLLLPPEDLGSDDGVAIPIVLNLDRLYELPRRKTGPLARYAADIAHRRREHGTLTDDPVHRHRLAGRSLRHLPPSSSPGWCRGVCLRRVWRKPYRGHRGGLS